MPGLCGIASRGPDERARADLERMIEALRHLPWYAVERFVAPNGELAVGHVHLGLLPVNAAEGRFRHGEEGDGFVEVVRDPARRRLTIRNDRFGMMPLFYCRVGDALVFATELKAVLAHPDVALRLDERGLADLLAFGFVLRDKTLVRGVRCLPGGAELSFDAATGEVEIGRARGFRTLLGRPRRGRAAALDRIDAEFRRAVADRCAGGLQVGVSLSGGLDSRTIMAAIDHSRWRVLTLTLDVRGGADQAIGEHIARETNGLANHRFVENGQEFFTRWPDHVREMVWLTDGMYYDEACTMMPTLDLYRELGIQVALRGHGGELARMHEAYELRLNRHVRACRTQPALRDQLFRQMNFALQNGELARLLAPELAAAMLGAARGSLDEAFQGIDPAWTLVDQVSCLYVEQYLARQCVPSLAELRSRVEVRLPFLDVEYVAAVLELPPEDRLTSGVHRELLRRNFPALLRITNSNTGMPAGAGDLTHRLGRKGFDLLKRYFGYERYRHYVDASAWLRGPLYEAVAGVLLDRRTAQRGLFVPSAVREFVEAHRSGRVNRPEVLLLLLFVELWQRLFVDHEPWSRRAERGAQDVAPPPWEPARETIR